MIPITQTIIVAKRIHNNGGPNKKQIKQHTINPNPYIKAEHVVTQVEDQTVTPLKATAWQGGSRHAEWQELRRQVLQRDGYTCQHCKGKSKDKRLHCHHIIFKEHGGSDNPENLIVMCKTCHDSLHDGKIALDAKGSKKGVLKHATQMNVIRSQVLKRITATETFGYITKVFGRSIQ